MFSAVSSSIERAQDTVMGEAGDHNGKVQDLKRDTVDVNDKENMITTDSGVYVSDTDDWLKLSTEYRSGPMLLEDQIAREKIMRFDHERIPERVVHARGSAAFGHFKLHESAKDVTYAGVLTDTSRTTPVFLRFSTVLGSRGSADTVRDVRGFAVKFYTEEGNWDIVGNNIPVFSIQDAMKFPDVIHAGKPEPHNEVPQGQSAHNNFWDFQYLHPEATHMFMWAMSDRGIPRSYRMMQGFGVNTYRLVNKEGASHFVKFHFTPMLGVHSLAWDEALKICGQDPDFHRKDLWEAIELGAFPTWRFGIQVLPESRQDDFIFDVLDATKIWPEELIPVRYIGELQLNRNPDEFFTQTEQSAFCTAHVVPGIDFSDDPLLQGRNFSYFDTQLSRLGANWQELPINRPICPVMNNNRDGAMRHRITKGTVNYWPNRFEATPPAKPSQGGFVNYPEKVHGMKQRLRSEKFQEHIDQAQLFYNSLSGHEKAHLTSALAFELDHCDDKTVYTRIIDRLTSIDLSLARTVAVQVGARPPQVTTKPNPGYKSAYISQTAFALKEPTIATRRIAIMVCDGYDASTFTTVRTALRAAGAFVSVISTRRAAVHPAVALNSSAVTGVAPDHHTEGMRSTLFDALFIPDGVHISSLGKSGRVFHWISEAFGHCKVIGAIGEAVALMKEVCGVPGVKFAEKVGRGDVVNSYGIVTAGKLVEGKGFVDAFCREVAKHRCWERETDGLTGLVAY